MRTETIRQDFIVTGMTCGHCIAAVTEEVRSLPRVGEVGEVTVDLDSGRLTLMSSEAQSREAVAGAVEEAGYRLA